MVAQMPDGTQLDLWFSIPQKSDPDQLFPRPAPPDNFGSILLSRTGSKAHNIALAERADKMNLHWNPYRGISQAGVHVAGDTEEHIYRTLGLEFLPPAERELADRNAQLRLIHGGRVL